MHVCTNVHVDFPAVTIHGKDMNITLMLVALSRLLVKPAYQSTSILFGCSHLIVSQLDRRQSNTLILSTIVDKKKSLETEISIAICRLTGDKWQSKALFLAIFDC